VRRSRSPFAQFTTTKPTASNGPPVMWVKGQRQQAPIPKDNDDELYTTVRARALASREASAPGETHSDMKVLYQFWSHFLCRNFNPKMYSEFRQYAIEDAREHAVDGMKSLISYYDEILISKKKVIPDVLALHYVELVNDERANAQPGADRPAFAKLRLAWRNGALDLKSRKKIDNLVDPKLREELER
jgi:la-related protein 1